MFCPNNGTAVRKGFLFLFSPYISSENVFWGGYFGTFIKLLVGARGRNLGREVRCGGRGEMTFLVRFY